MSEKYVPGTDITNEALADAVAEWGTACAKMAEIREEVTAHRREVAEHVREVAAHGRAVAEHVREAVKNGTIAETRRQMDATENKLRVCLASVIQHVTLIESQAREVRQGSMSVDIAAKCIQSAARTALDKLDQLVCQCCSAREG